MDNVATVCRFSNKKTPIQLKNTLIEEDEKNKNLIFIQLNQLFTLFNKTTQGGQFAAIQCGQYVCFLQPIV